MHASVWALVCSNFASALESSGCAHIRAMLSRPLRRPRAVAVRISREDYAASLLAFRGDRSLHDLLGGVLVDDARKVTPAMVVALHPLLASMIDKGLTNAATHPSTLEAALNDVVRTPEDHPHMESAALFVALVRDHITKVFGFLRVYKYETDAPLASNGGRVRRYPKTGNYRRKMSTADHVVVHSLTSRISLDASRSCEDLELFGAPTTHETRSRSPPASENVFQRGLALLDRDFGGDFVELPKPRLTGQAVSAQYEDYPPTQPYSDAGQTTVDSLPVAPSCGAKQSCCDSGYDEDGVLVDADGALSCADSGCLEEVKPSLPATGLATTKCLNPRPRQRKADVLEQRKGHAKARAKTSARRKPAAQTTPLMRPTPPAQPNDAARRATQKGFTQLVGTDELPLENPKMSGPTKEAKPRCELVAQVVRGGTRVRVHVMTSTLSKWGQSLPQDMEALMAHIRATKCSKKQVLEYRLRTFNR